MAVAIIIFIIVAIGIYFANKKWHIFKSSPPHQRTTEELEAEAKRLEDVAADFKRKANAIESIRKSREEIAKAKSKMNP